MNSNLVALSIVLVLRIGVMLFMEIGRRIGVAGLAHDPVGQPKGIGLSEGGLSACWDWSSPSRFSAPRPGSKNAGT